MNKELLSTLCEVVISDAQLHARWLNSLSLMENCGARKIARAEHPVHTSTMLLKHAAEEFRHAYYLRKLIGKLGIPFEDSYADEQLIAPKATRYFLNELDIAICRMLIRDYNVSDKSDLIHGAYLLVTYAIEVRADFLYGTYQKVLSESGSNVNVKSIIAEEEGHLEEMRTMLIDYHPQWEERAAKAIRIEEQLFDHWLFAIADELQVSVVS
jgi:rubrerythrin